jgi:putative ABC transport system permease protein
MSFTERLPLPLLLAWRSHFGSHSALSLLSLLSVAAAVTMASGLEMASRSVEAEISRTGDELAGIAQIEVTAGPIGVREELLDVVGRTEGVRVASPLIEANVRVADGPSRGVSLHLLGVDLLVDPEVRTYPSTEGARIPDPLRLVAEPGAVIVSHRLASELGLDPGTRLSVRAGRRTVEIVIRGILPPGGIADAFGGRIAIGDVYLLQTLLEREGWLDRIDVVAEPGLEVGPLISGLAQRLDGKATVRPSRSRSSWVESTLATVRLVVSAMVAVAVVVASLLSAAAMTTFVDRRAREFALLRTVGLEAHRLRRFLYVDALLLAAFGSALGLAGGVLLSRAFFSVLSAVTDFLQNVEIAELRISPSTVVMAAAVGMLVASVGIAFPARRASRRPVLDELGAWRSVPSRPRIRRDLVLLAILAALWLLALLAPLGVPPLARIASIFALGLAVLFVAIRSALPAILRRLGPVLERTLPGIGRLAGASLAARPLQSALHVSAIAAVLAGVTMSRMLGDSLATTLDAWTASQFPGGVYVSPTSGLSFGSDEYLTPEVVDSIRSTPGVSALFEQYSTNLLYRGEEVLLAATNMAVMAEYGRVPALDADPRQLARDVAAGQIAVSDQFAHRFGVEAGGTVTFDTPKGARAFTVAGVIRDYAGPAGSVNLDLHVFDELWTRPGARNVVIWVREPPAAVVRQIEERLDDHQALYFAYGDELERYASGILARFTRILDVVAMLTAALGGVAVLNLLLGSIAERRRDLALLRSTGATRRQVAALVLLDGLLAGLLGGLAGLALGVSCAYPLTRVVMTDALGWSLSVALDPIKLAALLGAVLLASLSAALYPAWLSRRAITREALAPE